MNDSMGADRDRTGRGAHLEWLTSKLTSGNRKDTDQEDDQEKLEQKTIRWEPASEDRGGHTRPRWMEKSSLPRKGLRQVNQDVSTDESSTNYTVKFEHTAYLSNTLQLCVYSTLITKHRCLSENPSTTIKTINIQTRKTAVVILQTTRISHVASLMIKLYQFYRKFHHENIMKLTTCGPSTANNTSRASYIATYTLPADTKTMQLNSVTTCKPCKSLRPWANKFTIYPPT